MYTEQLVDSVVGRALDVMTVSCVARSDSRAYRWRPSKSDVGALVYAVFLRRADVLSMSL